MPPSVLIVPILIFPHCQIFDRLKRGVDPKLQEEKTRLANEREIAQFEKAQRRLGELVASPSIFLLILNRAVEMLVNIRAESVPRFKTTLHYLLPYPQYVSLMLPIHGEVFLTVSSIL